MLSNFDKDLSVKSEFKKKSWLFFYKDTIKKINLIQVIY
jgi:hypothetical protein